MSANLIEVRNLSKYFPMPGKRQLRAVDDVSLDVVDGEVLGLVGESGSGKSTFGKALIGLHDKTTGTVRFRGELLPAHYAPGDFQRLAQSMQMIFQDPYSSLNPRMTVAEIIGEGLRLHTRLSSGETHAKVQQMLERVGLSGDHGGRYVHEFSGGQRQRIGIARALIMGPQFIVCDEPISALDVSVQAQIVNLLGELKRALGLTLLFIAHDLAMVRYVSDRMAVMYLGTIVEVGPADDVFFAPKHPYTQLLIASNPEPEPGTERLRRHAPLSGEIPSPVDIPPGCRFAGRCPKVMPRCNAEAPVLLPVADSAQRVACHWYDAATR